MTPLFKRLFFVASVVLLSACASNPKTEDRSLVQDEIVSFDTVAATVEKLNKQYGEENVLIVVDIDNTLLTSSVDLGGDIWYQWQRGKLSVKPSAEQQVQCLFEDSIGLLYELVPMNLTEAQLPTLISGWQAQGNTLFALTSRAPKYRAATERELARHDLNLAVTALKPKGEKETPVYREMLQREMSYMQGVMMTSGMNKGEMLTYILDKTGRSFDAIVFVDDSAKNITNVVAEFKSKNSIDRHIFHYVNIEHARKEKQGTLLTHAQANRMAEDWNTLQYTLKLLFPARDLTSGCLSAN